LSLRLPSSAVNKKLNKEKKGLRACPLQIGLIKESLAIFFFSRHNTIKSKQSLDATKKINIIYMTTKMSLSTKMSDNYL